MHYHYFYALYIIIYALSFFMYFRYALYIIYIYIYIYIYQLAINRLSVSMVLLAATIMLRITMMLPLIINSYNLASFHQNLVKLVLN